MRPIDTRTTRTSSVTTLVVVLAILVLLGLLASAVYGAVTDVAANIDQAVR